MNPAYNLCMWRTGFYEGQKQLHQDFMKVRKTAAGFYEGLKKAHQDFMKVRKIASGIL